MMKTTDRVRMLIALFSAAPGGSSLSVSPFLRFSVSLRPFSLPSCLRAFVPSRLHSQNSNPQPSHHFHFSPPRRRRAPKVLPARPKWSGARSRSAQSGRPGAPLSTRPAFSLVELLVVIGIIAVLLGILLPSLIRARESARRTQCLSNVRQMTNATMLYLNDNKQTLPEAGSTNTPLESPLCPRSQIRPAWTPLPPDRYVLPSIAALLQKYLGSDATLWRCPSAPADSFILTGDDPYSGHLPPNEFKPNYNYMAGKEMLQIAMFDGPLVRQFKLREWAVRNVSGLRVSKAIPPNQNSSQVVLFHDRESTYHSPGRVSIYTNRSDSKYYASYGYLDGHAEGRLYRNAHEYLGVMHHPIRQSWFGVDFTQAFPEQYAN